MVRHFGTWVMVLTCFAVELATVVVAEKAGIALSPSYNAERVHAVTCCDVVTRQWPLLRGWDRRCAASFEDNDASVEVRLHRFWDAPAQLDTTSSEPLCSPRERSLSDEFLLYFLKERLCVDLPVTHTELVQSMYSVFVVDNPLNEDDLIAIMEEACSRIQQQGVTLWRQSLQARTVHGAQETICRQRCFVKRSLFDGDAYDL
ncbi:putative phosphomannomutase-like protein [Trypanosoma conorhini]|uniref:Putative phosphomannomutase-like protein n=1 Tax=Trypanosoma conorhini TaxID=83891 RepID=A0A422N4G0_9TRYP|nr:putative phosphomannomutase-like protein [Trypanosoma conorhini]RNF00312.1 putative phosphomannomutase-like protein [Trypanosoma conorhini]